MIVNDETADKATGWHHGHNAKWALIDDQSLIDHQSKWQRHQQYEAPDSRTEVKKTNLYSVALKTSSDILNDFNTSFPPFHPNVCPQFRIPSHWDPVPADDSPLPDVCLLVTWPPLGKTRLPDSWEAHCSQWWWPQTHRPTQDSWKPIVMIPIYVIIRWKMDVIISFSVVWTQERSANSDWFESSADNQRQSKTRFQICFLLLGGINQSSVGTIFKV